MLPEKLQKKTANRVSGIAVFLCAFLPSEVVCRELYILSTTGSMTFVFCGCRMRSAREEDYGMLDGTKRLFPNDYQRFKENMIEAANDNDLPVVLQLDDIRDYTLKDLQDTFSEFSMDTGLEMNGSLFFCHNCGKLHLLLEISRDRMEDMRILQ